MNDYVDFMMGFMKLVGIAVVIMFLVVVFIGLCKLIGSMLDK